MAKVLIIWEVVPEFTNLYIVDVDEDQLSRLKRCHRKLINCHLFEGDDGRWLSKYMETIEQFKVDDEEPAIFYYNEKLTVIRTGFAL